MIGVWTLLGVAALLFVYGSVVLWMRGSDERDKRENAKARLAASARYEATKATQNQRLTNVAGRTTRLSQRGLKS